MLHEADVLELRALSLALQQKLSRVEYLVATIMLKIPGRGDY